MYSALFGGHLGRCPETRSPPAHVKGGSAWLRDVSGDHGSLPGSAADLCVANHFPAHPCLLTHLTLLSARSYLKWRRKAGTTHSTMSHLHFYMCQKAWCRCPEKVEFFKQLLLLQNVKQTQINSESCINHIKQRHMQGVYSSLSVQPFCQQHIWKQNVLPSHVF